MGNNLVYKYAITFFVTPPDAAVVAVAQFRAITHFLPSSLLWLLLLSITFSVASSVIVAVPLSEVRPFVGYSGSLSTWGRNDREQYDDFEIKLFESYSDGTTRQRRRKRTLASGQVELGTRRQRLRRRMGPIGQRSGE